VTPRATAGLAGGCVAALTLAACGTPSADLFVVTRDGQGPGAHVSLRVSDGGAVSCNGGGEREISSERLIDARAIQRDLSKAAKRGTTLPPRPGSVVHYTVRAEDGSIRFADNSAGQTLAMRRLQLLTRQLSTGPCGLPR
jgi:hypothetical protein